MVFSIDPNVKGAISESFDKSLLSDSFDVAAGCNIEQLCKNVWGVSCNIVRSCGVERKGLENVTKTGIQKTI